MRKSHLFIAVGTAILISGCETTPVTKPIMGGKTVIEAPKDDPAVTTRPGKVQAGFNTSEQLSQPPAQVQQTDIQLPQFEPMTDVVSSGGIESPVSARGKKGGKAKAAAAGTYTVKRGDTPERIARRHRVRLSDLMAANNLDETSAKKLQIGQKLAIPDGKAPAAKPAKRTVKAKSATTPAAAPALNADGTYTVRSGDTPERIARRHRVRLAELLKANNLDENSAKKLQIGQKLVIPDGKAPVAKPEKVDTIQDDNAGGTTSGNTESQITTVPPQQPTVTQPVADTQTGVGQSEVIVVELTEDMTLAALAAKYNSTEAEISKLNSDKTEFKRSDMVFVPKK